MATTPYDPVEFLTDKITIDEYLKGATESEDNEFYISCVNDAVRAQTINQLAQVTGLDRSTIFETFRNPNLYPTVITKIKTCLTTTPTSTKNLMSTQELVHV